jgi:predicted N-acetyltransferase YhbS
MDLIIRTEMDRDDNQVRQIHYEAFGQREDEARLVDRIRRSEYFVPELSLVAELEHEIVGHLLISKAEVVDEAARHEVLVLAPIAVKPAYQRQGVGKRLIHEGLERSKKLGFHLVMLIGHPTYYPKFGFKPARALGFELKQFEVPDEVFMLCELNDNGQNRIKGELQYPKAFFE